MRTGRFADEIDPAFCRRIFLASPLHDLGKHRIAPEILNKPGKLTTAEFEQMKRHTTIGAEALQAALDDEPGDRLIRIARDVAWSHHERYDGTGYPQGLAGDDIPLAARIVAVADVYDALTSARVYKPAMPHETAAAIIYAECGHQFDPAVVAAFAAEEDALRRLSAPAAVDPAVAA